MLISRNERAWLTNCPRIPMVRALDVEHKIERSPVRDCLIQKSVNNTQENHAQK
jgi:hypothetical protein